MARQASHGLTRDGRPQGDIPIVGGRGKELAPARLWRGEGHGVDLAHVALEHVDEVGGGGEEEVDRPARSACHLGSGRKWRRRRRREESRSVQEPIELKKAGEGNGRTDRQLWESLRLRG